MNDIEIRKIKSILQGHNLMRNFANSFKNLIMTAACKHESQLWPKDMSKIFIFAYIKKQSLHLRDL